MAAEVLSLAVDRQVDRVVIEDFILLPASVKGGMNSGREGLSSVRVGALVYAFVRDYWPDSEIYWQYPSVMKVIDSDRLKRAGMWVKGSEHARDAAKHLLIHLRKEVRRWAD